MLLLNEIRHIRIPLACKMKTTTSHICPRRGTPRAVIFNQLLLVPQTKCLLAIVLLQEGVIYRSIESM